MTKTPIHHTYTQFPWAHQLIYWQKIIPKWQRSKTLIIFMGNWDHQMAPKLLLFVICWQFHQFSCLPSSIVNGSPPKDATHSFVWVWCLHIGMLMNILCVLVLFISLPPAPLFYDTSEMVPIATPLRRWEWRRGSHPLHSVWLTVPVISAAAPTFSDLPRSTLVLFPSGGSHTAQSWRSRDSLLMICHLFRTPRDGRSV